MNFTNFHLYQFIVVGVAIYMILDGTKNFIRGKSGQSFYKFAVRLFVWGGMSFIALFPQFTNTLANIVGLEGNINAVILSGFLLIFLMIFKLLSAIERLEQQLSEVTRNEAIKGAKEKD